ncbi:MAG TPA: pteridine reductase [Lysobacter sp.]
MTEPAPVALITGSARRIGACIARRLHADGYRVAVHHRGGREDADALVDGFNRARADSAIALQAELAEFDRLPELVARTVGRFGRLDALVNNASAYYATPLGTVTPAQWDELFASNARAPFFLAQAAAPHLRESRGAIVNIADIYAQRPLRGHSVYCMAKAALVMATKALALELGPEVRVNAIAPGNILWSTNEVKAETLATVVERTALTRQGAPEDIADAVAFLLAGAGYVTGTMLEVDGGRSLSI